MVKQERAQSRLEVDRQDALEREDKKQLDQLVRQQKSVLAATAVEPKVKQSFSPRHPFVRSFFAVSRSSSDQLELNCVCGEIVQCSNFFDTFASCINRIISLRVRRPCRRLEPVE